MVAAVGSKGAVAKEAPLRVLVDRPPATLNPRATLDATGQRINALLFRGLTRIDPNLVVQPDLAESWTPSKDGLSWRFTLRAGARDQAGTAIDAAAVRACFENYRVGKPVSPLRGSFPGWTATEAEANSIIVRLSSPDPYLPRNLSLLRFFRTEGANEPCSEPGPGRALVTNGHFKVEHWDSAPEDELTLLPVEDGLRALRFEFVEDGTAMALKFLRGEADAAQNSLTLTKARWLVHEFPERFRAIERDGVAVAYLAFNLRDPILGRAPVRQAIALAIDRGAIIDGKLPEFCTPAGSFLSPMLAGSFQASFRFDPREAERLLDGAGLPRGPDGTRFTVHYKSTPVRDGFEVALMIQEMLAKIGVHVVVDIVEPAVFLASVRKGAFQLYSSRWIGVSDGSIFYRTLHSKSRDNRAGYHDAAMDALLERSQATSDERERLRLLQDAQKKMAEDLPYFPLWYWNNALVVRRELGGLEPGELSLSGALEPLARLR